LPINSKQGVDSEKYAAWLSDELRRRSQAPDLDTEYEGMKRKAAARNRAASESGRNIGDLPPVANPKRRKDAEMDFRYFAEAYCSMTFHLAWSPDHLKAIARIEQAVLHGGLFALAMPRGSGKTSLAECACLWAVLYGHRAFVCLVGASEVHAVEMLDSIKTELEGNELIGDDFPEAVFPIRCLDGIANRCSGQLYHGQRTQIGWTANEIIMPTMPKSKASGAIIKVAGITGRIRGMKFKRPDGGTARPELVVIDDPQTDESAGSLSQCATRKRILVGAVLGLAGPGKKISGIMPCTVIRPGDLADVILNRAEYPDWNGERTKMIYAFPTDMSLWEKYAEARGESLRRFGDLRDATAFYKKNHLRLEEGAKIAWPERFNPDEASALQHAMNLKLQDDDAFFAEYQNEPRVKDDSDTEGLLTLEEIQGKTNNHLRGHVPADTTCLTAFIDVQGKLLYYVVVAWGESFTGHVIDYGAYPDQKKSYFTLRAAQGTLQKASRKAGLEGAIYAGLDALTQKILGREWQRDDGAHMKIERCLIDANWGTSTDVVYQFCRQSDYAVVLLPSHGRFVGAASKPLGDYHKKRGDKVGLNWRIPNVRGRRMIRHVVYDTNFWKSFTQARLAVSMGDRGSLAIFGKNPGEHLMFAEHLVSEYRIKTTGRGRTVDEWKLRPDVADNHWLDCLVGTAVAASIVGINLPEGMPTSGGRRKRKRYTQEDLRRRA